MERLHRACMKSLTHAIALTFGIAGVVALPTEARAVFSQFSATGTSAGVPVTSTASFTTTAGQVALTLQNTTVHTADAGQLLTGIRFSLSPNPITTATLTSATAIPREIAVDGSYVDGLSQSILGTWESGISAGVYQLDFNPNAQFAIVGPADGETASSAGLYTGNGSINGNPGHNPFTAKSATFTLSSPEITAGTTITRVSFIYNTALSYVVPGTPSTPPAPPAVPEPSTVGFGLAILGVCGAARRRKGTAPVV